MAGRGYGDPLESVQHMNGADTPNTPPRVSVAEAVVLLDKSPTRAQVIFVPGGDTVVVPEYTGDFAWAMKPPEAEEPGEMPEGSDYDARWDAQDATNVLSQLIGLRSDEESGQIASLDKAINAITDFIKAEVAEMPAMCEGCDHAVTCTCDSCPCTGDSHMAASASREARAAAVALRRFTEAGRRHSAKDLSALRQIADLIKTLGAIEEPKAEPAPPVPDPAIAEPLTEEVEEAATPETITFRESSFDHAAVLNLREAAPVFMDEDRSVWITPIKPGFGNARDNFYYPSDTIREATDGGLFVGLKMYRDHPTKTMERDLPERSVKDWFATTKESAWDAASGLPRVRVQVHDDDVYRRFKEAPEQIAFSILGGGMARPGKVNGKDTRIVESFKSIRSVDWVTEAGAGGALAFAESAAEEHEDDMDLKDLTPEALAAARPDLIAAIKAQESTAPEAPAAPADEAPAWAQALLAKVDAIESRQTAAEAAAAASQAIAESKATAKAAVDAVVAESTLTAKAKAHIAAKYADVAFGEGQAYASEDAVREAVAHDIAAAESILKAVFGERSAVEGLGATGKPEDAAEKTVAESTAASLAESYSAGEMQPPAKRQYVFQPGETVGSDMVVVGAGSRPAPVTESGEATTREGEPAKFGEAGQAVFDDLAQSLGL